MSLILMIYLADIIEEMRKIPCVVSGVLFIGSAAYCFFMGMEGDSDNIKWREVKKFLSIGLLCACIAAFIPSKNTIYTMAGAYYGREIIKNPKVTAIGEKAYKLLEEKLDEALKKK